MSEARTPRLKGMLDALEKLRAAVAEEPNEDWSTRAFHGWLERIGQALEDDLSHLEFESAEVSGVYLLPHIDMAIAYLQPIVSATREADR